MPIAGRCPRRSWLPAVPDDKSNALFCSPLMVAIGCGEGLLGLKCRRPVFAYVGARAKEEVVA
jgi:hypothetical protein